MTVQNLQPGAVKQVAANEIQGNVYLYRTGQGNNGAGNVGWMPNGGVLQQQPLAVGGTASFPINGAAGMLANGCPSMVQLMWDNAAAVDARNAVPGAAVRVLEPSAALAVSAGGATSNADGAGPGMPQWFAAVQAAAQQQVQGIFQGTIYPVQEPAQGDFLWYFSSPSQVFNQGTFDYISANVSQASTPGVAQLSASGTFPNAYVQLISKIAYALSTTDAATVSNAKNAAQAQLQTMVTDYETTYGPITAQQMTTANVSTPEDYIISYVLGALWSGSKQKQRRP